jgi:putative flippase GtrA
MVTQRKTGRKLREEFETSQSVRAPADWVADTRASCAGVNPNLQGASLLKDVAALYVKHAKLARFLKFAIVGCSGVIINTAVLYFLSRRLHLPLAASSAVAVEIAVISNYLLNEFWTFASGAACIRRLAKFNVASLAGLSVNVLIVWSLTRLQMYFLIANLMGIGAAFLLNYLLSTTWVWSRAS